MCRLEITDALISIVQISVSMFQRHKIRGKAPCRTPIQVTNGHLRWPPFLSPGPQALFQQFSNALRSPTIRAYRWALQPPFYPCRASGNSNKWISITEQWLAQINHHKSASLDCHLWESNRDLWDHGGTSPITWLSEAETMERGVWGGWLSRRRDPS